MIIHLEKYAAAPTDDAFRAPDTEEWGRIEVGAGDESNPIAEQDAETCRILLRARAADCPVLIASDEDGIYAAIDSSISFGADPHDRYQAEGYFNLPRRILAEDEGDDADAWAEFETRLRAAAMEHCSIHGLAVDEVRIGELTTSHWQAFE